MKKALISIVVLIVIVGGVVWYGLSGADDFIRTQIEEKGSTYLGTPVEVSGVNLMLREGRLEIAGLEVNNPQGFSDEDAVSFDTVVLDLGGSVSEPYVVQEVRIEAPEILYEVNADGEGNLMVLKRNLQQNLPSGSSQQEQKQASAPRIIVENVVIANAQLEINFEKLQTGELKLDKKSYEVTLPTFNADPVGQPDGIPADQAGMAIFNSMLDDLIARAKSEAKQVLEEKAKEKAREKISEEKDKLLEKASDKLKNIIDQQ